MTTPLHTALTVCDQVSPMPMVAHEALLTLRRELLPHLSYEAFVADYWRGRRRSDPAGAGEDYHQGLRDAYIMDTGLAGEGSEVMDLVLTAYLARAIGGCLEQLKKGERDGSLDPRELALELGDVLYYLTRIAQRHGMSLADLKRINREKLSARRDFGKDAYTRDHVHLRADPVDWHGLAKLLGGGDAADLERAAGFLEGTSDAAAVIDEADAQHIAGRLRELARAARGQERSGAVTGEAFKDELRLARAVVEQGRRLRATAPVDDDFPDAMAEFDLALGRYYLAWKEASGRRA